MTARYFSGTPIYMYVKWHLFLIDGHMRYNLPDQAYPLGLLLSIAYVKLSYVCINVFCSTYEVDLYDVTTSYCFNLLLVYQDTNLFIILILCLVYYCLFKIIEEHLYNLYGDKVSVYPYLYGRFRRYTLKFYDFGCSLMEEFRKFNFREVTPKFTKFFPVSLLFLFDAFNIYASTSKSYRFKNFKDSDKFMHIYGL